ncbi:hypothetical protein DUNSADRAFT_4227 [Dunaliella salina]|uniref:Uncharacterized protein n=1 Tax=Dunaliella salina TaxID=3046 RepID=A0ABQ7GSD6_DUNSA|nr:hypothetical protein DUNSADRAFT_4227 [Dunaliella salina]|eukprot:KAF5837534.1 hypothetical protein DUNSADRAFT_4227 [Dunaliella salina]
MDNTSPPQASKRRAILQDHGVAVPQYVQPVPQQVAPQFPNYPAVPPAVEPGGAVDRAARHSSTPRKRGYEPPPPISKLDVKRTIVPLGQGTEPTYWTTNRWGAPAIPNRSLGPNVVADAALAGIPQQKRKKKHYQRYGSAQIKDQDSVVYSTLNDLETLMRAALGALASFNEDERMILTRQFRREELRAQAVGDYSPPGLINVAQFRHAFKKFSVRVSEEQAHAMFIKYGHDSQGLLPYDMFATKLLTSPARMLALEPEQKGAYRPGMDGAFRGKIRYQFCHKPVFPPTNWDGSLALRSAQKPKAGLQLEFVYGYAGKLNTCNNMFWTADGKIVYYVAAVGIVYDPETHTQQFFHGSQQKCKHPAV